MDGGCGNILGKRVGINFPWGQTVRRRARAPLSHGGCGSAGGAGALAALGGAHIECLPLTCHKVFSASGNFVNVNRARGLRYLYVPFKRCVSRRLRKLIYARSSVVSRSMSKIIMLVDIICIGLFIFLRFFNRLCSRF